MLGLGKVPYLVGLVTLLFLCGCANGRIKTKSGTTITPPKDAANSSSSADSFRFEAIRVPKGSEVAIEKINALNSTPSKEVITVKPSEDTELVRKITESNVVLSPPRAPDRTVELKKLENQERRWLLFAGIGMGVGGILLRSLLPAWPGLSNGAFAGAVLALVAWKLSDLPAWIWAIPVILFIAIALGYKKAEWDKDGDGVPDFLQRRNPKDSPQ